MSGPSSESVSLSWRQVAAQNAKKPGEFDAEEFAKRLRYNCVVANLPSHLQSLWVQLGPDADTIRFLAAAPATALGFWSHAMRSVLRLCCDVYDTNGLLGGRPMHVAGTEQWRRLLGSGAHGRLLDVGAGDGEVTTTLAPLFEEVHCTETSRPMAWTLHRRGFVCREVDLATTEPEGDEAPYDVVSVLNVLDRCSRPHSLLRAAHECLKEGGLLIIALVLPFHPCVFHGKSCQPPEEWLPIDSASPFETAVGELCDGVLTPLGFEVTAVARVPYLSVGDKFKRVYELDDAIVVCRKSPSKPKEV